MGLKLLLFGLARNKHVPLLLALSSVPGPYISFLLGMNDSATYLMIISQKLVEEVYGIIADKSLIFGIDETVPALPWKPSENVVVLRIKFDIVSI